MPFKAEEFGKEYQMIISVGNDKFLVSLIKKKNAVFNLRIIYELFLI